MCIKLIIACCLQEHYEITSFGNNALKNNILKQLSQTVYKTFAYY